jgi:hypothetical protein
LLPEINYRGQVDYYVEIDPESVKKQILFYICYTGISPAMVKVLKDIADKKKVR